MVAGEATAGVEKCIQTVLVKAGLLRHCGIYSIALMEKKTGTDYVTINAVMDTPERVYYALVHTRNGLRFLPLILWNALLGEKTTLPDYAMKTLSVRVMKDSH